jgi:hypothetical protein
MRTGLFLTSGMLVLASLLINEKRFSEDFPSPNWVLARDVSLWLAITGAVSKADYSVAEELPILLLLFVVPVAAAGLMRWRFI